MSSPAKQTPQTRNIPIFSADELPNLAYDRVIIGTFTGLYEIKAQLESIGIPQEKIDVGYIELSVRAREAFLLDFANEARRENLAGSVAELGVYRGDFARKINEAFFDRRLFLFDTFEGFCSADLSNDKDGSMGKSVGKKHFANTSVELVLSKMPNAKNCIVKKGWFPQSAQDSPDLRDEKFCFVNLDADLYEPILAGLQYFYPKMVSGGVILIHEYFSSGYIGVRQALQDFFAKSKLKAWQKIPIGDNLSIAVIKT